MARVGSSEILISQGPLIRWGQSTQLSHACLHAWKIQLHIRKSASTRWWCCWDWKSEGDRYDLESFGLLRCPAIKGPVMRGAPTGVAAHTIRGSTLYRLLSLPAKKSSLELNEERLSGLLPRLLVVDYWREIDNRRSDPSLHPDCCLSSLPSTPSHVLVGIVSLDAVKFLQSLGGPAQPSSAHLMIPTHGDAVYIQNGWAASTQSFRRILFVETYLTIDDRISIFAHCQRVTILHWSTVYQQTNARRCCGLRDQWSTWKGEEIPLLQDTEGVLCWVLILWLSMTC